jgi:hypothetical protein
MEQILIDFIFNIFNIFLIFFWNSYKGCKGVTIQKLWADVFWRFRGLFIIEIVWESIKGIRILRK